MFTAQLRVLSVIIVVIHSLPLFMFPSYWMYLIRLIYSILFVRIARMNSIGHYKAVYRYYPSTRKGVVIFNKRATAGWSKYQLIQALIHECIHSAQRHGELEIPFTPITDYLYTHISVQAIEDIRKGLARYKPKDLDAEYDAWVGMHYFTRYMEVNHV